ncbi:MAG: hypothetical protein GY803_31975, partial [Chloroflexi bacterium]|nr:hypothetical protein [Chloroflexota bacterium]
MRSFSLKIIATATLLGLVAVGLAWGTAVFNANGSLPANVSAEATDDEFTYLPVVHKPGAPPPQIAGCDIFPADNIWNTPVDTLPVHPNSANYIA